MAHFLNFATSNMFVKEVRFRNAYFWELTPFQTDLFLKWLISKWHILKNELFSKWSISKWPNLRSDQFLFSVVIVLKMINLLSEKLWKWPIYEMAIFARWSISKKIIWAVFEMTLFFKLPFFSKWSISKWAIREAIHFRNCFFLRHDQFRCDIFLKLPFPEDLFSNFLITLINFSKYVLSIAMYKTIVSRQLRVVSLPSRSSLSDFMAISTVIIPSSFAVIIVSPLEISSLAKIPLPKVPFRTLKWLETVPWCHLKSFLILPLSLSSSIVDLFSGWRSSVNVGAFGSLIQFIDEGSIFSTFGPFPSALPDAPSNEWNLNHI